jgi:hypothetical protein
MADSPGEAVAFLKGRLRSVPRPDAARLARLVADLGADSFEARARATRELEQLGELAGPAAGAAAAGQARGAAAARRHAA